MRISYLFVNLNFSFRIIFYVGIAIVRQNDDITKIEIAYLERLIRH